MVDCLFCRIVAGIDSAEIVYRDDEITAFRDVRPRAPTHILVVPNRHVASLDAVEPGDATLLGGLLLVAKVLAEAEGIRDGYRLVVNTGPGAGQSVFHLHMHLLGGRELGWPPG
jgi:histidine triad (HIT) family protein